MKICGTQEEERKTHTERDGERERERERGGGEVYVCGSKCVRAHKNPTWDTE